MSYRLLLLLIQRWDITLKCRKTELPPVTEPLVLIGQETGCFQSRFARFGE